MEEGVRDRTVKGRQSIQSLRVMRVRTKVSESQEGKGYLSLTVEIISTRC